MCAWSQCYLDDEGFAVRYFRLSAGGQRGRKDIEEERKNVRGVGREISVSSPDFGCVFCERCWSQKAEIIPQEIKLACTSTEAALKCSKYNEKA